MTTGEKLQLLRKNKNYTQEYLSDVLGVSRQTISRWESDVMYPETEKLIAIAKFYNCSIEYLLMDEAEMKTFYDQNSDTKETTESVKKRHSNITIFSITTLCISVLIPFLFLIQMFEILTETIYSPVDPYPVIEQIYEVYNYYKLVFRSTNILWGFIGIINLVCIAANIGLSITNICLSNKKLVIANKILNIVVLALTATFFFFNNIETMACYWVVIVLLAALVISQYAIKQFRKIDSLVCKINFNKIKEFLKSINYLRILFLVGNILILFHVLYTYGSNTWFYKYEETTSYYGEQILEIVDRRGPFSYTAFTVIANAIYISCMLLALVSMFYKNKWFEFSLKVLNICSFVALLSIVIGVTLFTEYISESGFPYVYSALFVILIALQYLIKPFENRPRKIR